ncbi:hypothetical protein Nepgr_026437 [Nepenthes gracilis]|uniref:Uncharacterized protein n=1 Tax=Nepenthes gracilis TaxID=150966 RepID=A0AAD3T8G0_NEPGR|nr:hypothetical protein Nepgr_026437 [Nepenthes gracilis]
MAPSSLPKLVVLCFFLIHLYSQRSADAQLDESTSSDLISDAEEWQSAMSLLSDLKDSDFDEETGGRRSLFWRTFHYYISYAALSANRIPCPPRSGRSYYTHNCYGVRGPVRPYYRGCTTITRCSR